MPQQKPGQSKQDYRTPKEFIEAVKRRLGIREFAFDFAANKKNTQATRYWSASDDSLSLGVDRWEGRYGSIGDWGWLNPPFHRIEPWAERCLMMKLNGRSIAFLVPASVGSNWFRDFVDRRARVLMLNGRLAFIPGSLYPKDCILCLFSPAVAPGYEVWNWREQQPFVFPIPAVAR